MKKTYLLIGACMLSCAFLQAQTKVFKEVSDEISSQIQTITQDNALVGYVVFTQLEKASKDSFNYRLSIMDENLNDIGKVDFREEGLSLQAVSFEQDVLCLAYLKSNALGKVYKKIKDYKTTMSNAQHKVFTQFLNLDGKIIKQNMLQADIATEEYGTGISLKQSIQLKNIPQKGFACFYGDESNNYLLAYDVAGNEVWKKKIGKLAKSHYLLTANTDIYLLTKKEQEKAEGGYELLGYSYADNTSYDKYMLKDSKGNSLKVLSFDIDPATGKPYLTGNIINPSSNGVYTMKDISKGPYIGVFTINVNGPKKTDYKTTYSYWNEGGSPGISSRGKYAESEAYSLFTQAFKDYQGNTYFVGPSMIRRIKWGSIASSIIFAPLFVVSPFILMGGTSKCKVTDAMVLKQTPNGTLTYDNTIPSRSTSFKPARSSMREVAASKNFYHLTNPNNHSSYVIVDDNKNILIYNVAEHKIARTIPHKDGNSLTYVYPAKEGNIMVSEYNRKEKYTRFSIESL